MGDDDFENVDGYDTSYASYKQKNTPASSSSKENEAYPLVTSPPVNNDDKVTYEDVDDFEVEYPNDQNYHNSEEEDHYDPSKQVYEEPYIPPTDDEGGLSIPEIEEEEKEKIEEEDEMLEEYADALEQYEEQLEEYADELSEEEE